MEMKFHYCDCARTTLFKGANSLSTISEKIYAPVGIFKIIVEV
ncbi:hypothetical protein ABNB59_22455 [Paenibacillus larvae]|uniref:Uncharacterized protein n=3 Tax=Paenibacillus larvae TaxID=1464 RepID=V9W8J9_9BACL|nr:hypothetical protein [Paenibacillus larvae]AHD06020.1 hypothetical protein ERIC2_c22251 [Paenibacillus larvae subsp. larvae DSM 25430]AVF22677.1 hypothetical protein ERICI_02866 [Paenibacillus larvae subsp. larvae]AVF26937.1 hypothetical protein ERICIII_02802 [Paenibacillus larvae subsp. larvae]AVF31686.1 hypothetical protein ERICIV_02795 [Paenibacillus larvae subsp. larvae]AVG12554.1 hypothetical protein ERICII_02185 [Paenibacillus larvae subsp. larvae DSM 25430]